MKACRDCRTFQPDTNFYKHRGTKDGLQPRCIPCHLERSRINGKNRDNYSRSRRSSKLKQAYGITADDYDRMFSMQSGVCVICGQEETNGKRLAVDHDHGTGKVRGLLCNHCNIGIGKFYDNPQLLQAAIDYLNNVP